MAARRRAPARFESVLFNGRITRVWARRGSRPTAVRQAEYEYLWVIGAASPQTGQAEAILAPCLNTAIINQFLDQFSHALAPDIHAAMIWDGAGCDRANDLKTPTNVTLIPLPPYSPELNGIENLWHYFHSHCRSNRSFKNDDDLFNAATNTWCQYALNSKLIKRACNKTYIPTRS